MITYDYKCPAPWRNIDTDPPPVGEVVWAGGIDVSQHSSLMVVSVVIKVRLASDGFVDEISTTDIKLLTENVKTHIWCAYTNQEKPGHPWKFLDIMDYLKVSSPPVYRELIEQGIMSGRHR